MNVVRNGFLIILTLAIVTNCKNETSSAHQLQVLGVMGGGAFVNASAPLVVLDCRYVIPPGEEAGLVVKWYHDKNPQPVYQRISGELPQALGFLKNRLDLQYQIFRDEFRYHSALAFVSPTTELTGLYTCRVATYFNEGLASTSLVIYNPAKEFTFQKFTPSIGTRTLTCVGSGLYPKPKISLTAINLITRRPAAIDASVQLQWDSVTKNYRITANAEVPPGQLRGPTEFECRLMLPGTEYKLEKRILMHSGSTCIAARRLLFSTHSVYAALMLLLNMVLLHVQTKFYK